MNPARSWAIIGVIAVGIMAAVGLASPGGSGGHHEFQGVYIVAFEYETFIEGGLGDSLPQLDAENVGYLSAEDLTLPPNPCRKTGEPDEAPSAEMFAIRFIGRREPGAAGHLGAYRARYLVDRVIEIRRLKRDC